MSIIKKDIEAVMEFLPHARAKILSIPLYTNQDKEFEKLNTLQKECVISLHDVYGFQKAQKINYIDVVGTLLDKGHELRIQCTFMRTLGNTNYFHLKMASKGSVVFETHSKTNYPGVLKKYFVEGEESSFWITTRRGHSGANLVDEVALT